FNKPGGFDESDKYNEKLQIISEFMAADTRIPEISVNLKEYSDTLYRYASKFINTREIAQQYKKRNSKLDIYGSFPIASAEIPHTGAFIVRRVTIQELIIKVD
ncbi:37126_t:CDS:2, partial [Racocetra persica]